MDVIVQFEEEFEQQEDMNTTDFESYIKSQAAILYQIFNTYMDGGLIDEPSGFTWGRFSGTGKPVGYISLSHFQPEDEDAFAAEVEGVLSSLADTEAIVLDIRVNVGGCDSIALLTASSFVSERILVFTKRAVDGDGYTDTFEVYVEV